MKKINLTTGQNRFNRFLKNHLIESLENYEGSSVYGCDLANLLTESENCDGSFFCNTYKTKEELKKYDDVCGDFVEHYKNDFGVEPANYFNDAEKFHVQMIICGAESLIGQLPIFLTNPLNEDGADLWNEQILLDSKIIKKLKKQIKEFNESIF